MYEKGKALRSEEWKGLTGKEHRCIENCKHGLELVVEENGVVYRGGFDDVESMKREVKLYGSGNSDNYLIPVKRAINIVKAAAQQ